MTYRLKAMWVGIQQKCTGPLTEQHGIWDEKMVGVVIRAARLRPLGHFMYAQVSINGKRMWAGGAEDRIFPFHHVTLPPNEPLPKDMIPALGFCKSGNGYAFDYKGTPCLIEKAAICGKDAALTPVPSEEIPEVWEVK